MARYYPWYTRGTDIVHRLTVVGLVGFTFYMVGSVSYTLYSSGKENELRLTAERERNVAKAQAIAQGNEEST
ncbi:hypothetical protein PACTADRAFT_77367 [Pachysolen tannophilus NRRL Y-2460]|uniref:Uncharacterized protein n=1 Tax=Pachysolen tannophilus NRRL Y-2460 TaxID=669874 RepID=A0A1E4TQ72_PACTA|nr:hypothetical protein PACTADRAFT_77367 [Pachysolen tannophilus NRRL Y-2460]